MAGKAIDETGKVYGTLRVLRRYHGGGQISLHAMAYWICYCDPALGGCGAEVAVRGSSLRDGTAKNCGCKRSENLSASLLRYWKARKEAMK